MLITRWLWARRSLSARLVRVALLPPSLVVRGLAAARARSYRSRLLAARSAPVPTVAVGNLTVGGSGKTPIAAWIAGYYAARGIRPGIVLRGYGGDEAGVHRRLVGEAIVIEQPDRVAGATAAAQRGARVVILDDAYQRLDIARDLNIVVVSAESGSAVRWTLPAGPWREGWRALRRADLVIVTRKRASLDAAMAMAARARRTVRGRPVAVARLGIAGFRGLLSGEALEAGVIAGRRVLASAGIADPDAFAAQCRAMGATVTLLPWRDHHPFSDGDVRALAHTGRRVDYVVVTEKDATKLRHRWPDTRPEPLVARLDLVWERGGEDVERALDAVVTDVGDLLSGHAPVATPHARVERHERRD